MTSGFSRTVPAFLYVLMKHLITCEGKTKPNPAAVGMIDAMKNCILHEKSFPVTQAPSTSFVSR